MPKSTPTTISGIHSSAGMMTTMNLACPCHKITDAIWYYRSQVHFYCAGRLLHNSGSDEPCSNTKYGSGTFSLAATSPARFPKGSYLARSSSILPDAFDELCKLGAAKNSNDWTRESSLILPRLHLFPVETPTDGVWESLPLLDLSNPLLSHVYSRLY